MAAEGPEAAPDVHRICIKPDWSTLTKAHIDRSLSRAAISTEITRSQRLVNYVFCYLLPAWINPSQRRGQPLGSFLSTSFDRQYVNRRESIMYFEYRYVRVIRGKEAGADPELFIDPCSLRPVDRPICRQNATLSHFDSFPPRRPYLFKYS